jgi:hypothetical protein
VSKKGDARIARAVEKRLRQKEKTARLTARVRLPELRTPRLGADPGSIFQMQMAWHCDCADRKDSWSWGQARDWGDEAWAGVIEPKLNEFAKLLWREIDAFVTGTGHKAHHSMPVENIDDEPQTRIDELAMEHDGDIFRFRLGAKKRLWGFRIVNVFEVLWYDPHHMIYQLDPENVAIVLKSTLRLYFISNPQLCWFARLIA